MMVAEMGVVVPARIASDQSRLIRPIGSGIVTLIMASVPWPAIWLQQYGTPMEDRRVYEAQVVQGFLTFDLKSFDDLRSYVTGEYLWGWFLNLMVRVLDIPLEVTFALISAFVIFVACTLVSRHAPLPYLLLLFNPTFIDLSFSQMRIALAIAMLCLAYLVRGPRLLVIPVRLALVLVSCLVHTSMIVFVLLFLVSVMVARRPASLGWNARYFWLLLSGAVVAMVLGPLRAALLSDLDDRRADTDYLSSSLKFYLIWFLMLLIFTIAWKKIAFSPVVAYAFAALVVIAVGLGSGVYVNRIIAVSVAFFVASIYALPRGWRVSFVIAYLGYVVLYWLYWLNLMH